MATSRVGLRPFDTSALINKSIYYFKNLQPAFPKKQRTNVHGSGVGRGGAAAGDRERRRRRDLRGNSAFDTIPGGDLGWVRGRDIVQVRVDADKVERHGVNRGVVANGDDPENLNTHHMGIFRTGSDKSAQEM